ncbi:aldolase [Paenibacillus sp. strain BS8-2]
MIGEDIGEVHGACNGNIEEHEHDNVFAYQAFGFNIISEIPFPGARPAEAAIGVADVRVEWGQLGAMWEEKSAPGDAFVILDNKVLFRIKHTAVYMVEAGDRVVVSPEEGAQLERIRLFLDGYCMAILLLQRNILPLHGSAVAKDGFAYALIGSSGAGKSTLAKAMLDGGYSFVSDDIIPVILPSNEKEPVFVWPALPEQKLWQESLSGLGVSSEGLRTVYEREARPSEEAEGIRTKYAVPVTRFTHAPMPLAGIIELVKQEERATLITLEGTDRLRALALHTFHRSLIEPLGLLGWHFQSMTSLANRTDMLQLGRPRDQYSVPELMELVLGGVALEQVNAS